MNKNILIASGVSVASLAAGGAAGYFITVKRLGKEFDARLASEVESTKGYYKQIVKQLEERVEDLEQSIAAIEDELPDESADVDEVSVEVIIAESQLLEDAGKVALVNYQGYSTKPSLEDVAKGITNKTPKKQLPPKDPSTGRFLPKPSETESVDEPSIISEEEFLENDNPGWDQQYLLYFINDKTLVHVHDNNESVNVVLVGEANLTLFPDDETSIFVRNPQLRTDYEIQPMTEPIEDRIFGADSEGMKHL